MQRYRIRERPDNSPGFRVSKRCTAVLDGNTLDTAGKVGLPVGLVASHSFNGRPLFVGQIAIPAQGFEHGHGEFRITVLDLRAFRIRAFSQKVVAIFFYAEAGAECQATFSNRFGRIVEDWSPRVPHFCGPPARPRHTVVFSVARSTTRLKRCAVERVLVFHMLLEALRRLAGVADGPHAAVEFTGRVFNARNGALDRNVLEHLNFETELLRKQISNFVISLRFKQRIDDLLAPLDGAVGRSHGPEGFELGRRRQQIDAVLAVRKDRRHGREWINHDEHVELFHGRFHVGQACLGVWCVAPEHHGADVVRLVHVALVFQNTIDPARHRNTSTGHQVGRTEATFHVAVLDIPNARPVLPSPFGHAIVAR
ncbi:hypothetical protein TRICHSKD4_4012 [Roseibium sp. TrichSKD4]|nr:hypothetical protein TRICHSKD4_4012 [Roseibium sp. TrichSKD4]